MKKWKEHFCRLATFEYNEDIAPNDTQPEQLSAAKKQDGEAVQAKIAST